MTISWQKVYNKILKKINEIPLIQHQGEFTYQKNVEAYALNIPPLSTTDLNLVEKLKHEGVVITSLENLGIPSHPDLYKAAKNLMQELSAIISDHHQIVIHASSQQIMKYPEIFLWGLEQRLLNISENYFGVPVAYHGAYVRRDIGNQIERESRLWHIDKEARRILKIIVYLNDVNENNSPFQYLPQSLTAKVADALKYKSGYILDQSMQKVISPTQYKSCIGAAGTVVFAATSSIFHRGKIPINNDRFTIFFDYSCRLKNHSFYGESSLPHSDLILLSKNLSEAQKQCIFWRF